MMTDLKRQSIRALLYSDVWIILETNMRMDYDARAKDGVHDWIQSAGGEGSDGQRNECGRHGSVQHVSVGTHAG